VFHYRKTHQQYKSFPKPAVCSFCEDDLIGRSERMTEHVYVMPNRVSYDVWEMRNVVDHLLVIPRKHVTSLQELSDEAKLDIMNILGEYEAQGYNIYARGFGSGQRSVAHQHTHLIKTHPKKARAVVALQKPYVLLKF
jgi:hypothetical protein